MVTPLPSVACRCGLWPASDSVRSESLSRAYVSWDLVGITNESEMIACDFALMIVSPQRFALNVGLYYILKLEILIVPEERVPSEQY